MQTKLKKNVKKNCVRKLKTNAKIFVLNAKKLILIIIN